MIKSTILLFAVLLSTLVVGQTATDKLPPAVPALDKRPQLCPAEPLETPLPSWKEGSFKAELVVGSDGRIHGLRTVESSYSEQENATMQEVLRTWRFKPTYFRGNYVNAKIVVEVKSSKWEMSIRFPKGRCRYSPSPIM
jgi:outer membrane biosynthesis protein TonB